MQRVVSLNIQRNRIIRKYFETDENEVTRLWRRTFERSRNSWNILLQK